MPPRLHADMRAQRKIMRATEHGASVGPATDTAAAHEPQSGDPADGI
jgi:hypothetical protein